MYGQLFASFFKIGLFTFGGGYAMLPLIQKEMLGHQWATESEILDYYALAQVTPGIIAVNVSTFIGYKLKGILGALCTMAGVIAPSLIIITILAFGLAKVWETPLVQAAFEGIQLMVPALILPIVWKMIRQRATGVLSVCIMLFALICALMKVSTILILFLCAGMSIFCYALGRKK